MEKKQKELEIIKVVLSCGRDMSPEYGYNYDEILCDMYGQDEGD